MLRRSSLHGAVTKRRIGEDKTVAISAWTISDFNSPAWLLARWTMGDRVYATQGHSFVVRLQTVLRQWRDSVVVDGVWGNGTTDALASYVQSLYGMPLADATRIVSSMKRTRVITPEALALAIQVAYGDEISDLPYYQRPRVILPTNLTPPRYGVAPPRDGVRAAAQPRPWSARIGSETVVPLDPDRVGAPVPVEEQAPPAPTPTMTPATTLEQAPPQERTPERQAELDVVEAQLETESQQHTEAVTSRVKPWMIGAGIGVLALGVTAAVVWKFRKE